MSSARSHDEQPHFRIVPVRMDDDKIEMREEEERAELAREDE